jgi:hypothetical protein
MHSVGNVDELYNSCKEIGNDSEILIFGAGFRARCIYQYITKTLGRNRISFAVSLKKDERTLYGIKAVQISRNYIDKKVVVIVAVDVKEQKAICNLLEAFNYKNITTINFDSNRWSEGAEKLFEATDIYKSLKDDESRMQYIGGMLFRFTRRWEHLFEIQRKTITTKYLYTGDKKYLSQFLADYNHEEDKKTIIYGFNSMTREVTFPRLKEMGVDIHAICTKDEKYFDQRYQGIPILSVEKAFEFNPDGYYILGYHWYKENEIKELLAIGIKKENIIYPCSSLTPFSYGTQYFDLESISCNENDEVFIDAGCLNCGSIFDFIKWSKGKYKKIYAFEPEKENYEKCVQIIRDKGIGRERRWQIYEYL